MPQSKLFVDFVENLCLSAHTLDLGQGIHFILEL
jgi:hypothetical protein